MRPGDRRNIRNSDEFGVQSTCEAWLHLHCRPTGGAQVITKQFSIQKLYSAFIFNGTWTTKFVSIYFQTNTVWLKQHGFVFIKSVAVQERGASTLFTETGIFIYLLYHNLSVVVTFICLLCFINRYFIKYEMSCAR